MWSVLGPRKSTMEWLMLLNCFPMPTLSWLPLELSRVMVPALSRWLRDSVEVSGLPLPLSFLYQICKYLCYRSFQIQVVNLNTWLGSLLKTKSCLVSAPPKPAFLLLSFLWLTRKLTWSPLPMLSSTLVLSSSLSTSNSPPSSLASLTPSSPSRTFSVLCAWAEFLMLSRRLSMANPRQLKRMGMLLNLNQVSKHKSSTPPPNECWQLLLISNACWKLQNKQTVDDNLIKLKNPDCQLHKLI